jgi:hypothetical protein
MILANRKKKQLNLELSPEAYDLLQRLADGSGKNMADVLRTGLALYGIAEEERQSGHDLAIVNGNQVVKQIVPV